MSDRLSIDEPLVRFRVLRSLIIGQSLDTDTIYPVKFCC